MANTTYQYTDYRKFLRETVTLRKRVNPHLTFAKLAEEIGVQRSYLSQVLAERYHLSPDQLYLVTRKLGLDDTERDYLFVLLEIDRCQVTERKTALERQRDAIRGRALKSEVYLGRTALKIEDELYSRYYNDPYCSLVHMYLVIPKYRKDIKLIREKLQISSEKLDEILRLLEKCQIIEISRSSIKVLTETLHLSQDSFLSRTHATLFRLKAIENQMRSKLGGDYHFTASISANLATQAEIKVRFLDFLKEISGLVQDAPAEEVFHLNFDLFAV